MKLVIRNSKIAATVLDDFINSDNDQVVIDVPSLFDISKIDMYVYNYLTNELELPGVPSGDLPKVSFSIEAIGPDKDLALINGGEVTVVYNNEHSNGIRANVYVKYMGHLLNGEDGFPDFSRHFRMPFQPVDALDNPAGTPIKKLIQFVKGVATIEFFPELPCDYLITQETISNKLNPEEMMILESTVRIIGVKV